MPNRDFYFYVTDLSGSPLLGIDGELGVELFSSTESVSAASSLVAEVSGGYYRIEVEDLPVSQGIAILSHGGDSVIEPQWDSWSIESVYDIDDLYSVVYSQSAPIVSQDTSSRYGKATLQVKEGDDWNEQLYVNSRYLPLTGWTSWTTKLYPATRLTDPSVAALGSGTVTVINATTGLIEVDFSNTITTSVVTSGASTADFYSDIQGVDGDGDKRTVLEVKWVARRDFNE